MRCAGQIKNISQYLLFLCFAVWGETLASVSVGSLFQPPLPNLPDGSLEQFLDIYMPEPLNPIFPEGYKWLPPGIERWYPPVVLEDVQPETNPDLPDHAITVFMPDSGKTECKRAPDIQCIKRVVIAIIVPVKNSKQRILFLLNLGLKLHQPRFLERWEPSDTADLYINTDMEDGTLLFHYPGRLLSHHSRAHFLLHLNGVSNQLERREHGYLCALISAWYSGAEVEYMGNGYFQVTQANGVTKQVHIESFINLFLQWLEWLVDLEERVFSLISGRAEVSHHFCTGKCGITLPEILGIFGGGNSLEHSEAWFLRQVRNGRRMTPATIVQGRYEDNGLPSAQNARVMEGNHPGGQYYQPHQMHQPQQPTDKQTVACHHAPQAARPVQPSWQNMVVRSADSLAGVINTMSPDEKLVLALLLSIPMDVYLPGGQGSDNPYGLHNAEAMLEWLGSHTANYFGVVYGAIRAIAEPRILAAIPEHSALQHLRDAEILDCVYASHQSDHARYSVEILSLYWWFMKSWVVFRKQVRWEGFFDDEPSPYNLFEICNDPISHTVVRLLLRFRSAISNGRLSLLVGSLNAFAVPGHSVQVITPRDHVQQWLDSHGYERLFNSGSLPAQQAQHHGYNPPAPVQYNYQAAHPSQVQVPPVRQKTVTVEPETLPPQPRHDIEAPSDAKEQRPSAASSARKRRRASDISPPPAVPALIGGGDIRKWCAEDSEKSTPVKKQRLELLPEDLFKIANKPLPADVFEALFTIMKDIQRYALAYILLNKIPVRLEAGELIRQNPTQGIVAAALFALEISSNELVFQEPVLEGVRLLLRTLEEKSHDHRGRKREQFLAFADIIRQYALDNKMDETRYQKMLNACIVLKLIEKGKAPTEISKFIGRAHIENQINYHLLFDNMYPEAWVIQSQYMAYPREIPEILMRLFIYLFYEPGAISRWVTGALHDLTSEELRVMRLK